MKSSSIENQLKTLIIFILFSLLTQLTWAANISVSVDRNPVTVDESFNIYFTASDEPDGEPDFSPLDQDFTVLNQNQSQNTSWVNGDYTKSIRWTVQAIAKKSGNITIPAVIFGKDTSKPLAITVNQANANNDALNANKDLFVEVKADPESPYVQSQILYTVRVYRRVNLAQAQLSEPELTDAVVEKLGNDREFSTVINAMSYTVTERKYAIFPQKSGELKIKPLALTADVVVEDMDRGGFGGFFGSPITKTKRVLSNEIALNVKPAPNSFNGKNWLPAEKLELAQTWSGDIQQMKAGEPITRTLTLRGTGVTVGQLPELNKVKADTNFKTYPDQPVLNEEKLGEGMSASRQEKIALIPSVAGKHTLPAVEIPWFNTKTQRSEVARIPETTINVIGDTVNQATDASPNHTQIQTLPKLEATKENVDTAKPVSLVNSYDQSRMWQWISLFLGLGWLTTLIYFLYYRPKTNVNHSGTSETLEKEIRLKKITRQLKEACNRNDSSAAKNALLTWGKHQFGANNLGAIAQHCEARLRDEILSLNHHLYSKESAEWNGKKLFQTFSENKAIKKINSAEDLVLEPLHRL